MSIEFTSPNTIVLIHGFWVTPRSWENWIRHYEARASRVLAPAYPGFGVGVEALNRNPRLGRGRGGDQLGPDRGCRRGAAFSGEGQLPGAAESGQPA
jgi:pimeloyl-ACP methyl ester carboxylesterase